MENRPKRSLSLKKQGQKKLNFTPKGQSSHSSSTPAPCPTAAPAPGSACLSGLCNLGNTCYANSILQVLRFCPHFNAKVTTLSELLLQQQQQQQGVGQGGDDQGGLTDGEEGGDGGDSEEWQSDKEPLVLHVHKLWQRMANKERLAADKSTVLSATRPQKFLSKLREEHQVFDNKMQQDAQEMLRFFLTSLHETIQKLITSNAVFPTLANRQESSHVDAQAPVSKLASRKRKLLQEVQPSPKTVWRRSKCSKKVTDFFCSASPDGSGECHMTNVEESDEPTTSLPLPHEELDFVKEMFQGALVSEIRCYECDGRTRRTEAFLDVSLAVSNCSLPGFPANTTPLKGHDLPPHSASHVGPFSLSWTLSQFCLREKLSGDNKYCCERCGHLTEAERSVMFGRLPSVMTLHLNRFATHNLHGICSGLAVNKVGGNVAIPLSLKFSAWCTEDCVRRDHIYHLIAVVFHTGDSCSSGHYTASVRGKECRGRGTSPALTKWIKTDRHWVCFDDELVQVITQEDLITKLSPLTASSAYILLYSV